MHDTCHLLFFGALTMMIVYNLGYLALLRRAVYASYFMFHASVFAVMLFYTGVIEEPWFDVTLRGVPVGVFFLAVLFFLAFSRDFLEVKTLRPAVEGYFDKAIVLNAVFLLLFAFAATSALLETVVVTVLTAEVCLLLLFAAYLGLRGSAYARYYLGSFLLLLGTLFAAALHSFGAVDFAGELPYLFEAGILMEAGGLSFAMAYQQKEAELRLRQKEMLFQELSHRVQNNLQQIISILTIQMGEADNAVIRGYLQETIERIRSISLIHKTLQNAATPGSVVVQTYLEALVEGYRGLNPAVRFRVECAPEIELGIEKLTPLALIINELITNSVKHGLQGSEAAQIAITLVRNGGMHFTYEDNGGGYAPSADDSLGTKLIRLLSTSQLKGKTEIETGGRYRYALHFSQ